MYSRQSYQIKTFVCIAVYTEEVEEFCGRLYLGKQTNLLNEKFVHIFPIKCRR